MRKTLLVLATALLLAAPTVVGHAAAPPRDFETRILHDHNDDSAVVLAGKHGFDAIALDVRDARLPDGRPALVLRLLLNGGCDDNAPGDCPELSHVVTFTAGGEARSVAFRTSDGGQTWTGDAARVLGPESLNDGTRFAVEGWVPLAELGTATGDALTDWFVEGYAGSEPADNMPEGVVAGVPDPLGAAFDAGEYVLGSPDLYVALDADATRAEAMPGDEVRFPVRVTNLLGVEQVTSLAAVGSPDARFELDGASVTNVTLAANFTKTVDLVVTAPDRDAPLAVVATTPLGGYTVLAFTAEVDAAPAHDGQVMGPDVPAGTTWSHTFTQAGTFTYHNHHAPATLGTVEVVDGDGGANHTVTLTADGFDPASLTVETGDTVTWVNDAGGLLMVMGGYDSVGGSEDHGDHGHDDHGPDISGDASEDAPGAPLALLAVALVGLAAARRVRK